MSLVMKKQKHVYGKRARRPFNYISEKKLRDLSSDEEETRVNNSWRTKRSKLGSDELTSELKHEKRGETEREKKGLESSLVESLKRQTCEENVISTDEDVKPAVDLDDKDSLLNEDTEYLKLLIKKPLKSRTYKKSVAQDYAFESPDSNSEGEETIEKVKSDDEFSQISYKLEKHYNKKSSALLPEIEFPVVECSISRVKPFRSYNSDRSILATNESELETEDKPFENTTPCISVKPKNSDFRHRNELKFIMRELTTPKLAVRQAALTELAMKLGRSDFHEFFKSSESVDELVEILSGENDEFLTFCGTFVLHKVSTRNNLNINAKLIAVIEKSLSICENQSIRKLRKQLNANSSCYGIELLNTLNSQGAQNLELINDNEKIVGTIMTNLAKFSSSTESLESIQKTLAFLSQVKHIDKNKIPDYSVFETLYTIPGYIIENISASKLDTVITLVDVIEQVFKLSIVNDNLKFNSHQISDIIKLISLNLPMLGSCYLLALGCLISLSTEPDLFNSAHFLSLADLLPNSDTYFNGYLSVLIASLVKHYSFSSLLTEPKIAAVEKSLEQFSNIPSQNKSYIIEHLAHLRLVKNNNHGKIRPTSAACR